MLFVVGGILGALLIVVLFNWALITISSIAGASMVASSLPMAGAQRPIVLLLLIVLGVVVQSVAMRREGSPPEIIHMTGKQVKIKISGHDPASKYPACGAR